MIEKFSKEWFIQYLLEHKDIEVTREELEKYNETGLALLIEAIDFQS